MMDNKTITITTNLFKLEVYWNGKAVSAQLAIFIGLLAVSVFAQEQDIINFMLIILLIDVVAVLYMIFKGASIDVVSEDGTKVEQSVMQTKVDNTPQTQPEQQVKKPGPKPSNTINNKVPVPNPTTRQTTNPIPPQPVEQQSVEAPPQPPMEEPKVKSIDDLSPEEWDDLFNMD